MSASPERLPYIDEHELVVESGSHRFSDHALIFRLERNAERR